ncbi:hypothetical protein CSOJ01_08943 [Colletotrichum sojae]|uniref:Uncharacterized protein n=1 Tax=Colletotrichum sojae TaxID=2175907 RepID=A0A8H6MRH1_9PEZI|nr:hypothetical protein CSOJ01_08943 [Colletotrichum sojae]
MPLSCGNDTAAAVRRDCVFEPLSNRWLPKRCGTALGLHVKPTLKAIDSEPYRFYRDPRGEREIHEHDWAKIPLEKRHHFAHCVNLLMQGAAGLAFGGMIEEHARDWEHVKHCADTILTAAKGLPGWNKINSFVRVRAGECY